MVVDSANGAASELAAAVFEQLGAEVVAIGCEPDGTNINAGCGSTSTELLAGPWSSTAPHLGLALDGDADRLLAVDETGTLVDGDALLALFARDLADRGQLAGNTVVVTVMTNLGFRRAMEERGIHVKETDVGDRHVLAAIDKEGFSLGGEQSGHIIFRRLATTGDGLLTGLVLADLLARTGPPLAELLDGFIEPVPQTLVNVRGVDTSLYGTRSGHRHGRRTGAGRHGGHRTGARAPERHRAGGAGHGGVHRPGVAEATAERLHALIEHELLEAARPRDEARRPPRPRRSAPGWTPPSERRPGVRTGAGPTVAARRQVAWPSMCGIIGITRGRGRTATADRSSTSWSRAWPAWSTAATTRPAGPGRPDGRRRHCGGSGPPTAPARSTTWSSAPRTRRPPRRPASATPGGPPTAARARATPTPTPTARASWPWSTTASSRTTPSCPTS